MNQNNGHHRLSAVDVIDEERASETTGTNFYDATNPEFRPAKPIDVRRKKSWKRKLVGWSVVLLLICGAAVALYLLLRVNRESQTMHRLGPFFELLRFLDGAF